MSKDLNADEIRASRDFIIQPQEVPEWGGTVYLRSLSGTERDSLEAMFADEGPKAPRLQDFTSRLLCMTLCSKDGQQLFPLSDMAVLGKKNAVVLKRLFEASQKLSGLGKKEVDEIVKNSEGVPDSDSGSS